MSAAVTIDDEAPALEMARAPRNLFGFVLLHEAAESVVAPIRQARASARTWRDRANGGELGAARRNRPPSRASISARVERERAP